MVFYEKQAQVSYGAQCICGCDEAGRGPLAGPLIAAAVHIPVTAYDQLIGVNDSKKLSPKKRSYFFDIILSHCAIGISILQASTIDKINIYEASRQAMLLSVRNLRELAPIDYILTDAMPLPSSMIPYQSIIKGDQKSLSIAAASIVAKQIRDQIMIEYDRVYPQYSFAQHKGYATAKHLSALTAFGIIENIHRVSYKPVQSLREREQAK